MKTFKGKKLLHQIQASTKDMVVKGMQHIMAKCTSVILITSQLMNKDTVMIYHLIWREPVNKHTKVMIYSLIMIMNNQ